MSVKGNNIWTVEVLWTDKTASSLQVVGGVGEESSEWLQLVKAVEARKPWSGKYAALPATTNIRALRITKME